MDSFTNDLIPHIHADIIKAWAIGHKIQSKNSGAWYDVDEPLFRPSFEYRIKPTRKQYIQEEIVKYRQEANVAYVNYVAATTKYTNLITELNEK
jgi:hypothetical protein